jgi:hypothetical protein
LKKTIKDEILVEQERRKHLEIDSLKRQASCFFNDDHKVIQKIQTMNKKLKE